MIYLAASKTFFAVTASMIIANNVVFRFLIFVVLTVLVTCTVLIVFFINNSILYRLYRWTYMICKKVVKYFIFMFAGMVDEVEYVICNERKLKFKIKI